MTATTVKIDRAEFEEIVVSLGALAGFADRIYAGASLDSMLWNETLNIQKCLIEYAGLPEQDEARDEAWYQRECKREKALLEKYVAGLVAS